MHDGNIDEFFEHENQACPPSLSHMGKLRTGTKSDLLGCLEDLVLSQGNSPSTRVQVSIIDVAAIVNMLRPGAARKFSDYVNQVFILSQLQRSFSAYVLLPGNLCQFLTLASRYTSC